MEGLIIDWMDGRHLQFETFEEAESEFKEMTKDKSIELDVQLFRLEKEYNNIKN